VDSTESFRIILSCHLVTVRFLDRVRDSHRTGLQYLFQQYRERGNGGANDYTAHGVFGTLTWRLN
jgi:hypothetical protein